MVATGTEKEKETAEKTEWETAENFVGNFFCNFCWGVLNEKLSEKLKKTQ